MIVSLRWSLDFQAGILDHGPRDYAEET